MATMLLLGGNAWAWNPTEGDYSIATSDDLVAFSAYVNAGNNMAGMTVTLANDIDMAGVEFTPIGTSGKSFGGTFDGQENQIQNLTVNSTANYVGLFGSVFGGTIKNLYVSSPNITNSGENYTGAIVGGGYAMIDNCYVTGGSVTGVDQVGAVIGYLSCGYVKNCTVDGVSVTANGDRAGGITGKANVDSNYDIVNNVVKNATIVAAKKVGEMRSAAALVGQVMASATNHWVITDNTIINVTTTTTNKDNVFVPVGEFRGGCYQADAVTAGHIARNHWEPATEPDSYTMVNPANTSESVTIENFYVAKIGDVKYATLQAAFAAAQNGETITLLADVENTGDLNLKAGVTLDGDNHKVSGNSAIHINAAGGTVKNVNFENIHNDAVVGANQYGLPETAVGTQTAIEASGLTGAVTITGCTFDNCDWDAIRVVPSKDAGEDLAITITNNIFKHTNATAHQLRYIHLEYVQGTSNVGRVNALLNITDNQFLDQNQSGRTITAILVAKMDADEESNLTGNYYSNREAIEVATSYNVSIEDFYPMRSQANVDVDDLQIETAQIGSNKYATLAAAFEAANATTSGFGVTIKLLRDVVVNETYTVNNISGKWIALENGTHALTANVPLVNASTQFNFNGGNGLVTVPAEGEFFIIQEGAKLLFQSGIFSSNSVEKYLDQSKRYMKDLGDGSYQITQYTNATAKAAGLYIATSLTESSANYYASVQSLVDAGKATAFLLGDYEEAETINMPEGKKLSIHPNGFTFKGAVNSTNQVGLYANSTGTVIFTNLNAATLANSTSTAAITIENGNVKELKAGTGVTPNLTIKGGTYRFDPTAYVAEGYEAVDNGDGTYTVQLAYKPVRSGLTVGKYGTICLEKNVISHEGATFYSIASKAADLSEIILVEETGELAAGQPYIFMADAAEIKVVYGTAPAATEAGNYNGLVGSFVQALITTENSYIILNNKFYLCGTENYVGEHRAYIYMPGVPEAAAPVAGRRYVSMATGEARTATSMENVENATETMKFIENGQIFILRDGQVYNVAGQLVK